jgi:hypothetical protein
MDEQQGEQVYQAFIEKNTSLVPREFEQNHGIHFQLVLRKLSLAKDYTTDLFYLSKSSGDWHCVLIELEKPQSKYFKDGSADFHSDFLQGLAQIYRWQAWFKSQSNLDGFINGTIGFFRTPIRSAPCHIKYVLVHGRRSEFENNEQRRNLIAARESDDFHILSYDSLLESLHTKYPLYVGSRHNEYIEILSEEFVGDSIFSCLQPEQLRIRRALANNIANQPLRGMSVKLTSEGPRSVLDEIVPMVPIVD